MEFLVCGGPAILAALQYGSHKPKPKTLPEELFAVPVAQVELALSRLPQLDMLVRHFFSPGQCARELTIPKGTLLTARRYLAEHTCVLSAGQMTIWGDDVEPYVVDAPYIHHGVAGERRIGYAHETAVWTSYLPVIDGETDPDKILAAAAEIPEIPPELLEAPIPAVLTRMLDGALYALPEGV